MGKPSFVVLFCLMCAFILAGCDIPTPPPEFATPTAGSQNPESDLSTFKTSIPPTPVRASLTPLPVGPGSIYFVRGDRLWRVSPDGGDERKLSDLLLTSPPSPSPDGAWVAFTSGRELYAVPSSGGEARRLATGDMADRQRLGWHPNGGLVGYMTFDLTTIGAEQAWAAPLDGSDPVLIAEITHGALGRGPTYERMVKWSPDGNWVAVSNVSNPFRLLRWPLASGSRDRDRRDVPGGEIDWSPESRTILYSESLNGELGLFNILENEGEPFRTEAELVGTGLGEYALGPLPQWSPASLGADSDLIAYRSRTTDGEPQIAIRRRGGRELPPLGALTNNPTWSPAGDRLVFETGVMNDAPLGKQWSPTGIGIADIDPEGNHTAAQFVTDAKWPAWGR